MTPAALADLHAACFSTPRPWSEAEFHDLLLDTNVQLLARGAGFIMIRIAAGEAEILTLAVEKKSRRQGIGHELLAAAIAAAAAAGAQQVFLEVSAENDAAINLYETAGFQRAGRRKSYYKTPQGRRLDALLLGRQL